ncbi:hypothetical protein F5B22DRAFT_645666 [Xylaria bambusicola]|uniref:uncharacterized protein n=1 Tax=Xylaria bambusicola TaxID=326684 RepID=UPI002008D52A|nr:uncharacterized protein F5B22DRAFT_645666 [Xylaria bambusicola]KAI0517485.1 hypothetical protein F5B22DRAFT_645666 [Xylaria bambusicola]
MKLIIAGSTGFLATELIRQALAHPGVTSVIALGRREASVPAGVESNGKFKSVICKDFENYSDDIKSEIAEADACIWYAFTLLIIQYRARFPLLTSFTLGRTIAIVPGKLRSMSWEEACKISRDYAVTAIETISQLRRDKPNGTFRFIYVSGHTATRDPSKKPLILPDYSVMRGEAETRILKCAQESNGAIEASVAKPGLIDDPKDPRFWTRAAKNYGRMLFGIPKVEVKVIAATLVDQVVNGLEKDTLENKDLVRIGTKALAAQASSS